MIYTLIRKGQSFLKASIEMEAYTSTLGLLTYSLTYSLTH